MGIKSSLTELEISFRVIYHTNLWVLLKSSNTPWSAVSRPEKYMLSYINSALCQLELPKIWGVFLLVFPEEQFHRVLLNKSYLEKNKKDTVMCSFDESLSEMNPITLFYVLEGTLVLLFCFVSSSTNHTEASSINHSEVNHKIFLEEDMRFTSE